MAEFGVDAESRKARPRTFLDSASQENNENLLIGGLS